MSKKRKVDGKAVDAVNGRIGSRKSNFWRIFQIDGCIEQKQRVRLLFIAAQCANTHAGEAT
jgi:hypothetical protein